MTAAASGRTRSGIDQTLIARPIAGLMLVIVFDGLACFREATRKKAR